MARIAGVDLPREKRVEHALPYIYGIGLTRSRIVLERAGINPDIRVKDLAETEVSATRVSLCASSPARLRLPDRERSK